MTDYIIYWAFYIIALFIFAYFFYNWKKMEKHTNSSPLFYYAALILIVYLMCGPFYCIFQTNHDIQLANEYRDYQKQVILPIEDRYNNIQVPDGYYYLGCEVIDIQGQLKDGVYEYYYIFAPVDDENYKDISYVYSSTELLRDDVPYLLTMDSMATSKTTDDQIVVVWACVN